MAGGIAKALMGLCFSVLLLIGAACPSAADVVLRRGNGGEPTTLDPHRTDGRIESNILRDLFEGLVTTGPDGRILPGVAESWQIGDDGMNYTFRLRADAKWSNGDSITAADFVFSLRRAIGLEVGRDAGASIAVIRKADTIIAGQAPIDQLGVDAPDPLTVHIALRNPAPYFLALMASDNKALPVHRSTIEKYGDDWAKPGRLVSNGAYQLAEWSTGKPVVLTRNPNFHHAAEIKIDKVLFYPIADAFDELKQFQAGMLDVTNEVPQQQVKWISLTQPREFWNRPYIATYYYALNLTTEPFRGNLKLRQALAMAVNRDALVNKITRAGESPAYGLVPPAVQNYHHQSMAFASLPMAQSLEKARRLFAEAGYSPAMPLTLEILYNTSENNTLVANAVISMWKEAFGKGIVVNTVATDRTEYLRRRSQRAFQVVRAAWIGDFGDPTVFLNLLRSTAQPPRNDSGFKNAKYDELLVKASETNDVSERAELLQQAEKLMLEEIPIIPLYHYATKSLVSQRVKGWLFNIRDVHPTRFLWLEG